MNNRIITFAFFFSFSIGCNFLIAQSYLSFGSSGVQHEDTLHIGDSIHFSFWLVNQGNVPVNDSLQVLCETFDIIGSPISSMVIGGSYNTASSLDVGDSILINITELVTVSSYAIGDNIIVIWPASIFPGSVDTSFTPIHILNSITVGLELSVSRDEMVVSPNPTNDYLILSNNLGSLMKGFAVFDDQGNFLYINENDLISPFCFDLSAFCSGVYFVSTIINNQRIVKRVILVK
tara:strand:- start:236 stop:937 length:702 start_codon:yes stop_codon:yes gene_type:complete